MGPEAQLKELDHELKELKELDHEHARLLSSSSFRNRWRNGTKTTVITVARYGNEPGTSFLFLFFGMSRR
uniref:DUF899 domain-containing protein n=1 Tax=Steinernema glaseri TaxID=37863 RepID=A0A1I7ZNI5_9BILA